MEDFAEMAGIEYVRIGKKIDVILDDEPPGRSLDEAVGIEGAIGTDADHAGGAHARA